MLTELNLFKEFAICSIDELRDEKIRLANAIKIAISAFGPIQSNSSMHRYECVVHAKTSVSREANFAPDL